MRRVKLNIFVPEGICGSAPMRDTGTDGEEAFEWSASANESGVATESRGVVAAEVDGKGKSGTAGSGGKLPGRTTSGADKPDGESCRVEPQAEAEDESAADESAAVVEAAVPFVGTRPGGMAVILEPAGAPNRLPRVLKC